MNIVNKLTVRHLKQNKKRTLVTILGTIISVAMVSAVATLGLSFMDMFQRNTMVQTGEWHVAYEDVTKEQLYDIRQDDGTEDLILSKDLGFAKLEGSKNESKPYLFIKEMNEIGYERFHLTPSLGRMPKAENEIVLTEKVAKDAKVYYEIGDTVTLAIGDRVTEEEGYEGPLSQQNFLVWTEEGELGEELVNETNKEYEVVGIIETPEWEPAWGPAYTALSYVDEETMSTEDQVNGLVVLNDFSRSLYKDADTLAEELDVNAVSFNNELLRYYGLTLNDSMQGTLYGLLSIIIAVIVVGSVALIFNAFAISVSERSRHLGMLSSVGATKRQKRNSVFFEGFLIGLISIPFGLIAGIVGIGITFYFINNTFIEATGAKEGLQLIVTPTSLFIATAISAGTIFISTYIPAIRASRITAIDAIRQTQDLKLTGKAVKTSKLVTKIFGIEAEIGLKNLKRNKRRYQVTVFSLMISIILFLSVSYFTESLKRSVELSQSEMSYDIEVSGDIQDLKNLVGNVDLREHVTATSINRRTHLSSFIDEEDASPELRKRAEEEPEMLVDGQYPYSIQLIGMEEDSLTSYAEKAGIDVNVLEDQSTHKAIIIDEISYGDDVLGKYVETHAVQMEVGERLELVYESWESGEQIDLAPIEVAALTSEIPMGINDLFLGELIVIVTDESFDDLVEFNDEWLSSHTLYLTSEDPLATQTIIEESDSSSSLSLYNYYQVRQQETQMMTILSVFTYGFITLITLISVANIFNTISTSIALRKREFAMLKSVGMTPKSFNKMIRYESMFYGIKSLLYGLPLSIGVMYLIYYTTQNSFSYTFTLPWLHMMYVIIAVFMIVGLAMFYSMSKVKKENIIDALKQENV